MGYNKNNKVKGQKADIQVVFFKHEDSCTAYKMYKTALTYLKNSDTEQFLSQMNLLFEYHNIEKRREMRTELFDAMSKDSFDIDLNKYKDAGL